MNEEFYIGQQFYQPYPPEAAIWCNKNNAQIDVKYNDDNVKYYEIVEKAGPSEEEIKNQQIALLKYQLDETDYKIIKCSEYQMAGLELPYDITELHLRRQSIRDEINELEG